MIMGITDKVKVEALIRQTVVEEDLIYKDDVDDEVWFLFMKEEQEVIDFVTELGKDLPEEDGVVNEKDEENYQLRCEETGSM